MPSFSACFRPRSPSIREVMAMGARLQCAIPNPRTLSHGIRHRRALHRHQGQLLLLALLALPFALPGAPAQAAQGMEVALQDDPVFAYGYYYDRQRALQHAFELNATRIRVNVLWSVVLGRQANNKRQPRRLRYNFSYYDPVVNEAAA